MSYVLIARNETDDDDDLLGINMWIWCVCLMYVCDFVWCYFCIAVLGGFIVSLYLIR